MDDSRVKRILHTRGQYGRCQVIMFITIIKKPCIIPPVYASVHWKTHSTRKVHYEEWPYGPCWMQSNARRMFCVCGVVLFATRRRTKNTSSRSVNRRRCGPGRDYPRLMTYDYSHDTHAWYTRIYEGAAMEMRNYEIRMIPKRNRTVHCARNVARNCVYEE